MVLYSFSVLFSCYHPHWHIVIFLLFPDSFPLWLGAYLHGGTENLKKAQTFSS